MSGADRDSRFDYTTVGHVTVDVMADGSRRLGGSAFYSGLQAARLGQRVLIVTRGDVAEVEELLEPYRGELALEILPAPQTTTLETSRDGAERRQRLLAWAGPIGEDLPFDTSILHLAPVARETPRRWRGRADFVGLTPQGLVRAWPGDGGKIGHVELNASQLPEHFEAIVISESERESCARLLGGALRSDSTPATSTGGYDRARAGRARGAVVAITDAEAPTEIRSTDGTRDWVEVPTIEDFRDDVGAGDVFAAAFFVAMLEGRAPAAAARFANAAAAVRIGADGAGAIGNRLAIEARLKAAG